MKQQETTLKSLISAAAIALMATSASADRVQWPASEGGNGHEYEVVLTPGGMNWTDAKAAAEQAGGHLATVSDMAELDFINSLNFSGTSKGWIGGYQDTSASDYEEPYGGWRWVTDEPWSFVGWWDGAPSSSPTRNFVQLAYTQCQDEIDVDNEGEWYVVEYEVASSALQWASNGHWYEFVPVDQNWDLHNAEALARGAHLVTITSAAEGQFVEYVRDLNDSQAAFHTGGYQDPAAPDYSEPAGGWRWVTGEPFNYTNWGYSDGAYQPNNEGGTQNRIGVTWQTNQIWMDVNQTTEWFAILEWSNDCNGDGMVDYGQILDGSLEDLNDNGIPDCCDDGSCQIITVAQDGSGDFTNIQDAVDAAANGAQILVAPGTYAGHGDQVVRLHDKQLMLQSTDGPESTFIDGEDARRCVTLTGPHADVILEGFTLTRGMTPDSGGGLILSNGPSATFRNLIFDNCHAGWEGGGMNIGNAGSIAVESCHFANNIAFAGGGLAVTSTDNALIDSCMFEANSTIDDGAGLLVQQADDIEIRESVFANNSGDDDGGAIWFATCSNAMVTGCTMTDNLVTSRAGGIHVQSQSSVHLMDCKLQGNQGHNGGAVFVDSASELNIDDCEFIANQGDGGALQMQGGTASVENSIFEGNTAYDAGAIYCWNALITVFNCDFIENAADDDGGAMLLGGGTAATIGNSKFCGNTAPNGTHIYGGYTDAGDNSFADNCDCPADVDDDGIVNVNDILIVIAEFGTTNPLGDVNGDGFVNVNDLLMVLDSFGADCP